MSGGHGIVWPKEWSGTLRTEGMFSARERLKDYESYLLSNFLGSVNQPFKNMDRNELLLMKHPVYTQMLVDFVTVDDELLNYLYHRERVIISYLTTWFEPDELEDWVRFVQLGGSAICVYSLVDLMERNDDEQFYSIYELFSNNTDELISFFKFRMFCRQYIQVIESELHRAYETDGNECE